MVKKLLILLGLVSLPLGGGFWWLAGLFAPDAAIANIEQTRPESLAYLNNAGPNPAFGKILAVVTSTKSLGSSGRYTGYEHTELARAYYVFQANGFDVDIASPLGGEPPAIFDDDDMGAYDYAFLNDESATKKVANSIPLAQVNANNYQGVYFVGGKGAMFDFPDNPHVQKLVASFYRQGKVIGAVCHGPAALVNVSLDGFTPLVSAKRVGGFSNAEELLLMPNAETIFPFLLQNKLQELGAEFSEGPKYLEHVVQDQNLLTGQNPWSVWVLAEAMVRQLGVEPKSRPITREERAVDLLLIYESLGNAQATQALSTLISEDKELPDRHLITMHVIVALMELKIGKASDLIGLVKQIKGAASSEGRAVEQSEQYSRLNESERP